MILDDAARAFLERPLLGHLVTLDADGSPQVTVVWFALEDDEIVSGHIGPRRKLANVRRDPRVALSVEGTDRNQWGLTQYLVVHGTARITDGGAPELLQRLAHSYIGPTAKYPPMDNPPPGHILHITIDRITGEGPWK